ncbi:MAG: hypothetical protein IID03_12470 [Candidatus Dadabacteria bacterium]|nr:hypothetical protein [Candidatus Dadabacteria bacterium]
MLVQPFDNNPFATEVKTGAFNIAADEYALVTAEVQDGGTFSIDATVALSSIANGLAAVAVGQAGAPNNTNVSFTVPANHIFEGQVFRSASGGPLSIGGIIFAVAGASGTFQVKAGPSQTILIDKDSNSMLAGITGYVRRISGDGPVIANFWVPASTALTITGDAKYTVQRYKVIT